MSSPIEPDEADRAHRRDRACMLSGSATGAGLGALVGIVGIVASSMGLVFAGVGALAGAVLGKLVGLRISADEWDPPLNRRAYVGGRSPDDDIASA